MRLLAKAALLFLALAGASIGAPPNVLVSFSARLRPANIDTAFIIFAPFKYVKFHRKFELANVSVDRANGQICFGFFMVFEC